MTHYIYCSTLIFTIVLRVPIILLFTVIVVIVIILLLFLLLLPLLLYFIYLFHLIFTYLYIYFLICGRIRPEGSPFSTFFDPGMLRVEGVG